MTWLVLKTDKVKLTNQRPCFICSVKVRQAARDILSAKTNRDSIAYIIQEGKAAEILIVTSALPIIYFMYIFTSYAIGT
jgi:hypothetical protein